MTWRPQIKGSTTLASYLNQDLNGRKIKTHGYAALLDSLGPSHLMIPDNHTGTLTGLVELTTFMHEPPNDLSEPIQCTILVEVCWDDVPHWHDQFCPHGRNEYRKSCLIDLFMSSYKIVPCLLYFVDDEGNETHCVENELENFIHIDILQQPTDGIVLIAMRKMIISTQ